MYFILEVANFDKAENKKTMITVKMTEMEYKAYLLYLKSIEVMRKAEKESGSSVLDKYLANPQNREDLEAGLQEVQEGQVTYVDPEKLWENIK